ncbi:MAG: type I restriction enzyme HsdR N-terminal domain-containing protein [Selenomonas sp.]|nr:type I restriction enzyme HsdR N-terminal domain-containing protein [Selenomonas sp.]
MNINFNRRKPPKLYSHQGKKSYLDPIRNKMVEATPEETIRQQTISFIIKKLNIPKNMIQVEEPLSHYGIDSKCRADIIITEYNQEHDSLSPIAIIECKAPTVIICEDEWKQVYDYCNQLHADYAMLINGIDFLCSKFLQEDNQYIPIESAPTYQEMLNGEYHVLPSIDLPPRTPFDKLKDYIMSQGEWIDLNISSDLEDRIAIPTLNLWECLLDTSHKLPIGTYKLFNLKEDFGLRYLRCGNMSGFPYNSPYRSFLVNYNGNDTFVSFSVAMYSDERTCLMVAIDNGSKPHHALQMSLDDGVETKGPICDFWHNGHITIGNLGSRPANELIDYVHGRLPELIDGCEIYIGRLKNDHLWYLDEPQIIRLITNLIAYALIRDDFRNCIKKQKARKR